MEAKLSKIHEMQQKRSKREVYGDTGLSQETRENLKKIIFFADSTLFCGMWLYIMKNRQLITKGQKNHVCFSGSASERSFPRRGKGDL